MRTLRCFAAVAGIGAAVGFAWAARAVFRHGYLAEGLWRSALWLCSRGALVGVLSCLGGGIAALVLLLLWSVRLRREVARRSGTWREPGNPLTCPDWAAEFTVFLVLVTGLGVLALPAFSRRESAVSYPNLAFSLFLLYWIAAAGIAVDAEAGHESSERDERRLRARCFTLLAAVAIAAFLHIWAGAAGWQLTLALGLAAAVGLFALDGHYLLLRPLRSSRRRAPRPFVSLVLRRPGVVLTPVILGLTAGLWTVSWAVAHQARSRAALRGGNVILIGIDTLRADCTSLLSADEHSRDLTPNLRSLLASRGTVFSRAISQGSCTLPAFASILTGLYPAEHGAEHRGGVLSPRQVTIAEILREAGFRTHGISSGASLTKATGLGQGFEVFDESLAVGQEAVTSARVTDKAIGFLRSRSAKPFFLFLHYFDPHWNYCDHEQYRFADGYPGGLREAARTLNMREFQQDVGAFAQSLEAGDLAFLRDLYEEEIAFTDSELGRLFRAVEAADLWDSTLVIVVGDHGEEFGEHGGLFHSRTVCQELIHVPLAVAYPSRRSPPLDARPVETRAIFQTVLEFADIRPPAGRSYPPSLAAEHSSLVRSSTHSLMREANVQSGAKNVWWTCIQDDRWKLMKEHLHGTPILFDLAEDPGEMRNCLGEHPECGRRLERELDRLDAEARRRAPRGPAPEPSAEQRRRLRALGYL